MEATFYTLTKRKNSTKLPQTGGTSMQITLKDSTSILNPDIELQGVANPTSYNYCQIPLLSRYYFVSGWSYSRGIWTASLTADPLSSWKSGILSTTVHVLFSSSDYDTMAFDARIPATASYTRSNSSAAFLGLSGGAQVVPKGYFALVVLAGTSIWATGAATTYFLTYQQMQTFAHELLEPTVWEQLTQFFQNPIDAIIECYYLPVDVSNYIALTTDQAISVGDYTFTATGKMAQSTNLANKSVHTTIEIPWKYSDYRRLRPYSEVSLFVPYCGSKTLENTLISDIDQVLIDYSVDVTTGAVQAICYVKQEVLAEFSGNMKVDLPVGQTQSRIASIIDSGGSLAAAGASIATGNIAGGVNNVVSAVQSVATPAEHRIMGGFSGSILGAILGNDVSRWQQFRLVVTSRDTTDTPENMLATWGNVCSKVRSLTGLSGYVRTYDASVALPATDTEIEEINNMLDSGIYIE